MKRSLIFVPLVLLVLLGFVSARARDEAKPAETKPVDKSEPAKDAKDAKPESRLSRDTNGNVVVKLDQETQKLIGLKAEALTAAQLTPEIKAYGRVLDPAPLAALITELATAQAAYAASSNELARLKALSASGNASARALQAAEASELHDQLQMQSARDRLVMAWGKWVVEQPDLPAFVQTLTGLDNALIRLDLSAGQRLPAHALGARVVALSGHAAEADVLGRALGVDPQTQGQGIMLQVKTNDTRFLVGESVTGFLKTAGDPFNGVIIPRSAMVQTDGATWIYVQSADEQFTRKQVALDHPVEDGWFITNGVVAGEKVVVTGAQSLLSEELKGSFGPPSD